MRTEEKCPTGSGSTECYLLRWSDALLLIKLCALLGFAVQAQALFKGLLLQHEGGAQPQVVGFAQVLQHTGPDGDGRHTLRRSFNKAVQGAGLAVPLGLVAAAAQERAHFTRQSLGRRDRPSNNTPPFYFSSSIRTGNIDEGILLHVQDAT